MLEVGTFFSVVTERLRNLVTLIYCHIYKFPILSGLILPPGEHEHSQRKIYFLSPPQRRKYCLGDQIHLESPEHWQQEETAGWCRKDMWNPVGWETREKGPKLTRALWRGLYCQGEQATQLCGWLLLHAGVYEGLCLPKHAAEHFLSHATFFCLKRETDRERQTDRQSEGISLTYWLIPQMLTLAIWPRTQSGSPSVGGRDPDPWTIMSPAVHISRKLE